MYKYQVKYIIEGKHILCSYRDYETLESEAKILGVDNIVSIVEYIL